MPILVLLSQLYWHITLPCQIGTSKERAVQRMMTVLAMVRSFGLAVPAGLDVISMDKTCLCNESVSEYASAAEDQTVRVAVGGPAKSAGIPSVYFNWRLFQSNSCMGRG